MAEVKFLKISELIKEDYILKNDRKTNRLPREQNLSEVYGVSRETIRKALSKLIQEGTLYSIQGSGYFIKQEPISLKNSLNTLSSITEMIQDANLQEGDMHTKINREPPTVEAKKLLRLEENEEVYVLHRIRTAMNEPVVFSVNILPYHLVGKELEQYYFKGSLSDFLRDFYEYDITDAIAEINAIKNFEDIPEVFRDKDYPLLKFAQTHYLIDGTPILLSYDYMRNDVIKFYVERKGRGMK